MIHSFKCKDCKDTIKDNHTLKQLYLMKSFRTKNILILITSKITFEKKNYLIIMKFNSAFDKSIFTL